MFTSALIILPMPIIPNVLIINQSDYEYSFIADIYIYGRFIGTALLTTQ